MAAFPARATAVLPTMSSTSTTIGLELDQLAADPGGLEGVLRLLRQIGGQLHQGEVGPDRDVPEVTTAQATLVGQRPDDLARLHLVALADLDPVRREPLGRRATLLGPA